MALSALSFLLCGIETLSAVFAWNTAAAIGAELLALYGVSRFALGNRRSASITAAAIAVYLSQISFGLVNSVESMVFPALVGSSLLYPLVFSASLAAFGICACCLAAVLKLLTLAEDSQTPYIGLLLFPGLFCLAAELYILHTSYRFVRTSFSLEETGARHTAVPTGDGPGGASVHAVCLPPSLPGLSVAGRPTVADPGSAGPKDLHRRGAAPL